MDPAARSNDPRSFNRQPIWARACVISAGVIMNLIFGVIFFIICFTHGVGFNPAIVGDVGYGSPAMEPYAQGHQGEPNYHGLQLGDEIISINGVQVKDFGDLAVRVALSSKGEPVTLVVRRDDGHGHPIQLTYLITPQPDPEMRILALGIMVPKSIVIPEKQELPPDLQKAGVTGGMKITAVNGTPVENMGQFNRLVSAAAGKPVQVTFVDPKSGKSVEAPLSAEPRLTLRKIEPSTPDDKAQYIVNILGLVPATQVATVLPNSPGAEAGMKDGDVIAQADTLVYPSASKLIDMVKGAKGRKIEIKVLRDNEIKTLTPVAPNSKGRLNITLSMPLNVSVISDTLPGSPASALNLTSGSRIVSINGELVSSFGDMQRILTQAVGASVGADGKQAATTVAVGYQLAAAGQAVTESPLTISPEAALELREARWTQPLSLNIFDPELVPVKADNPLQAAHIGVTKTWQFMVQTWLTVGRLFQGSVPVDQMSGPLGIATQGTRVTMHGGWPYLLWFLGLISANLAVINFLPIPVVDGGHILLMIIEKLKGSPVSAKVQVAFTYVGLFLILSLFLYVTYHDILRLLPS